MSPKDDEKDDDKKTEGFETHEEVEQAEERGDITPEQAEELHEEVRKDEAEEEAFRSKPFDFDRGEDDGDETPFGTGD